MKFVRLPESKQGASAGGTMRTSALLRARLGPGCRRAARAICAWALVLLAFAAGCGNRSGWNALRGGGGTRYVDMALDSEQPDQRRRGVIGLSESRDGATDWAIKVYDSVARNDADAMVRWTALRALAQARAGSSAPTALKLLKSADKTYEDVRAAPPLVRQGAAMLLHALSDAGVVPPECRHELIETALASLRKERDHQLRLALIETLGYFPDRAAADRLIELLDDEDFAVVRSAEFALARMTGVTHRYEVAAWQAFFASESDPFARGGALPAELLREPDKPRWDWLSAS